jgi:hypothetical protein
LSELSKSGFPTSSTYIRHFVILFSPCQSFSFLECPDPVIASTDK